MAKEVERKFLVSRSDWRAAAEPGISIVQFYIAATPERSVRVRIRKGTEAALTLKFGVHDRIRDEFEYPIPPDDAHEMMQFATGAVIEKTRHLVRHHGHVYEVDVFGGALTGLTLAELETGDAVADEALPAWLGREVTGADAYYNATLARSGLPELVR